jgi:hypothetical protein
MKPTRKGLMMEFDHIDESCPGMIRADLDRQLMVRTRNDVGKLAEITAKMATESINLIAMCAYSIDDTAALMFVTDDNNHAKSLLQEMHYKVEEEEVILLTLENHPGTLQRITDKISEAGIDLKLMYGSVDPHVDISRIVLISEDNLDTMLVIKTELERH